MQPRIDNPVMTFPGALEALQNPALRRSARTCPKRRGLLVELRASQINGCSVCVDMHSRELKAAGEPDELHPSRSPPGARRRALHSTRSCAALALTEAATRLADRPAPVLR